jgi:DNA-binding beta-propeller fold protein YncE
MTQEHGPSIGRLAAGKAERILVAPAAAPVEGAVDRATGTLYWINGLGRIDVGRAVARGGGDQPAETILRAAEADLDALADVAVHDGALYLIDYDTKFSRTPPRIVRTTLDGTGLEVVVEGELDSPRALAVGTGGVAWADGGTIMRTALDGSGVETVFTAADRNVIKDVALDPASGTLYWIESGFPNATLWALAPDASAPRAVLDDAAAEALGRPSDLTAQDGVLYWLVPGNFGGGEIGRADADGANVTTVRVNPELQDPTDLLVAGGALHVLDQDANNVLRLDPTQETSRAVLAPQLVAPTDVAAHPSSERLFWIDPAYGIGHVRLDGTKHARLLPEAVGARSLAVDAERDLVYWAHTERGIFRAALDGSDITAVVRPTEAQRIAPLHLALDPTNEEVYWMDRSGQVMRAAVEDGTPEVLAIEVRNPGPLAVNPATETLYWVDLGDAFNDDVPAQLIRAGLDGTGAEALPVTVTAFLKDLDVDPATGRLYWSDESAGTITRAESDGQNPQAVAQGLLVQGLAVLPTQR